MTKYFIQYNNNPNHNLITDCVIRAIAKAFYKTWSETILELATTATKTAHMINSPVNYGVYLTEHHKRRVNLQGTKLNINQLTRIQEKHITENSASLRWLIQCEGHLTAVVDGHIYDTWDCGRRHVKTVWIDPENFDWVMDELEILRPNLIFKR